MSARKSPAGDEKPKTRKLLPVPVFDTRPAKAPEFMVINGHEFVAQTEVGEIIISLKIPTRLVPELEDLTTLEQVMAILRSREAQDTLDALDELEIVDTRIICRKFFQAFGEREQARLGESFGSSTS